MKTLACSKIFSREGCGSPKTLGLHGKSCTLQIGVQWRLRVGLGANQKEKALAGSSSSSFTASEVASSCADLPSVPCSIAHAQEEYSVPACSAPQRSPRSREPACVRIPT